MPVYHLEIRKFPRAVTLYNQTGTQVGAILLQWVQDRVIELDDQKWNPLEATITVLESPPIPVDQLSMGRGWRTAQREGTDVTERVLSEARGALADGSAGVGPAAGTPGPSAVVPQTPAAGPDPLALGVELAGLLGSDAVRLLSAWRAVVARTGGLTPSESLALAEGELQAGEDR
jgi:hypothetical protein